MVEIMRKRYVISRSDEILCTTSRQHVFKNINDIGNIDIMTYSTLGRAYSSLRNSGIEREGIKIIEVREIISEELNGLI